MNFINNEEGATAIEYGMISSVMFGLIMTAWGGVYFKIADAFGVVVTTLSMAQLRGRSGFDGGIEEDSAGSRETLKSNHLIIANNNNHFELALAA